MCSRPVMGHQAEVNAGPLRCPLMGEAECCKRDQSPLLDPLQSRAKRAAAMQHTVVVGPLGQAAFLAKISCVALQNVRGPVLSGHMSARTAALASS